MNHLTFLSSVQDSGAPLAGTERGGGNSPPTQAADRQWATGGAALTAESAEPPRAPARVIPFLPTLSDDQLSDTVAAVDGDVSNLADRYGVLRDVLYEVIETFTAAGDEYALLVISSALARRRRA